MAATAIPIDTLPSINPATGEVLAHVPRTSPEMVAPILARARDARPVAVEVGDQPFQFRTVHRPVECGLIGDLISRLMQAGVAP